MRRKLAALAAAGVLGSGLGVTTVGAASANPQSGEGGEQPVTYDAPGTQSGELIVAAGTFQEQLGCAENWMPACDGSALALDDTFGLYTAQYDLGQGDYEYKITSGGNWDLNWGLYGHQNGDNISFTSDGNPTRFVFDPDTGRSAAGNQNLMTVAGSFQNQMGCGDWSTDCLGTTMFETDSNHYQYVVSGLNAGTYEYKVVRGLTWDHSWGSGGNNASFTVSGPTDVVTIHWNGGDPSVDVTAWEVPGADDFQVIWLDRDTMAWPLSLVPGGTATAAGALDYSLDGWSDVQLSYGSLTAEEKDSDWRVRNGYVALRLTDDQDDPLADKTIRDILRGPIVVEAKQGAADVARTGTQIAGVLDSFYGPAAKEQQLGVVWDGPTPTLRVWAPTATGVSVEVWLPGQSNPMGFLAAFDEAAGTWAVEGDPSWKNAEYLWEIDVYVPSEDAVVTNTVTDPYSKGLTVNSIRSVIVDMTDEEWAPGGWADSRPTPLRNQAEQTIYELHVRDFSIWDETVSEENRGSYMAFTETESNGMKQLAALADAGLTTLHLLPTFDISTATIPELRSEQVVPSIIGGVELLPGNLSALEAEGAGPSTGLQQAAVYDVRQIDGFNWGYDPMHWGTPEGSYATTGFQDGGARNKQYREMVSALHNLDLHVVQDVVFNHTAAAGQDPMSVLDRVVPGYYHRLNKIGQIENSTCCSNVATENTMAEKIMVDTLVAQAVDYHIDGFRFDLMGHHSLENMENIRAALDQLTIENDGVDGKNIYLYGEGWNFGEVSNNALFPQATISNIAGSNIGVFNDRLRDAVRGSGAGRLPQGFGTGQYTDPNGLSGSEGQEWPLVEGQNAIMAGLTGSLKDFQIPINDGNFMSAKDINFNGQPVGFTTSPQESVNYVEAHDNETLFDIGVLKMKDDTDMETRVRLQALSNATVLLGQSPAFIAAGTEILRSKSLDRDSYNSGDWFNAIDWTMEFNNFAKGLPTAEKNIDEWETMKLLLNRTENLPGKTDMEQTADMVLEFMELRSHTPLFTLGDADLINEKVSFPNARDAGVVVMAIDDPEDGATNVDPVVEGVLVVFNAKTETWSQQIEGMTDREFELSEIQANGTDDTVKESTWDPETGTVSVPARTVAVFFDQLPIPDPTLSVDPVEVVQGGSVLVTGSDWLSGEVTVFLKDAAGEMVVSEVVTVGEDGELSVSLAVPADAEPGDYVVAAANADQSAEVDLAVTEVPVVIPDASLSVDPVEVVQGGSVLVTGSDWLSGEVTVFLMDAAGGVVASEVVTVGEGGELSVSLAVPADAEPGDYVVVAANDDQEVEVDLAVTEAPVVVEPGIRATPAELSPGETTLIEGWSWGPRSVVTLSFRPLARAIAPEVNEQIPSRSVTVGADGSFSLPVMIPASADLGRYEVVAEGPRGEYAFTVLTVQDESAPGSGGEKPGGSVTEKPGGPAAEKPGTPGVTTTPATGTDAAALALLAAVSLMAGLGAVRASRRV